MDFDDIQMAQSLGFKESSYSRYSDKSNSPKKFQKYVCYTCGANAFKSSKCKTCKGLKYVGQNNPMVQLLSEIMSKKLSPNNKSFGPLELPRQTLKPQFSEIKQQSELADDKIVSCDNCYLQGQLTEYSYCKQCAHFYLCTQCAKKGIEHEHPLTKFILSASQESSEQDQEGTKKLCDCCSVPIPNKSIYLICNTCKDLKITYEICQDCANAKNQHSQHIFKPQLHRIHSKKSQIQNPLFQRWISSQKGQPINSQYLSSDDEQKQQDIMRGRSIRLLKKDSEMNIQENESPTKKYQSRIKVDYDESESSYSSKYFDSMGMRNEVDEDEEMVQNSNLTLGDNYFDEYECDNCGDTPKYTRYHCSQCEDYDLCQKCFTSARIKNRHEHKDFQKVTIEQERKRKQKKQEQKKKMVNNVLKSVIDLFQSNSLPTKK